MQKLITIILDDQSIKREVCRRTMYFIFYIIFIFELNI